MMIHSKHVFNWSEGHRTYQVIDNEEESDSSVHSYTVLEWMTSEGQKRGRLLAQDINIYATSKLNAVEKYREKRRGIE